MTLNDINQHILAKYSELIESHDITEEDLIKSSASITMLLFENAGVDHVEIDGKTLNLNK